MESQVVEDVGVVDDVSVLEVDLREVLIKEVFVQRLWKENVELSIENSSKLCYGNTTLKDQNLIHPQSVINHLGLPSGT